MKTASKREAVFFIAEIFRFVNKNRVEYFRKEEIFNNFKK